MRQLWGQGMAQSDIIDIQAVEKQFKDEWLLFEVTETDDTDQPLRGRLLCHDPDRDVVHQVDLRTQVDHAYITFTGQVVPDGFEAAL